MERRSSVILENADLYFEEIVKSAFDERKISTFPMAQTYLVNLLRSYVSSANFFIEDNQTGTLKTETLAELYFKAGQQTTPALRLDTLKRLGDLSLYVSGFFGDSLQKKTVDVDYYAEMGGLAYGCLSSETQEDFQRKVFKEYSVRFLDFMEVLSHISQKMMIQSDENLLRLYDRFIKTGDRLARDLLLEKGLIPNQNSKSSKQ